MTIQFLRGDDSVYSLDPTSERDRRYDSLRKEKSELIVEHMRLVDTANSAGTTIDPHQDAEIRRRAATIDVALKAILDDQARLAHPAQAPRDTAEQQTSDLADIRAPWRMEGEGAAGWSEARSYPPPESSAAAPRPGSQPATSRNMTDITREAARPSDTNGRGTTPEAANRNARSSPVATDSTAARAAVPQIRALSQRLATTQTAYIKHQAAREKERASIVKGIKKTALVIVMFAILIATACEILSIVDLGWILSWLIPIFTWFMARRITGMKKAVSQIVEATTRLHGDEKMARQRLLAILPASERAALGMQSKLDNLATDAKSYVTIWIRDSVLTQLVELIPVVDWLPFYLGQVVKMVVQQNIEYQKTQKLMPAYVRSLASVEKLERMELEYLQKRLQLLIGQLNIAPGQQPRANPKSAPLKPTQPATPVQPRPAPVRDIAPSLSPAAA